MFCGNEGKSFCWGAGRETKSFRRPKKTPKILLCSVRKNAEDLKNALESVVIPMFCNATISKFTRRNGAKSNRLMATHFQVLTTNRRTNSTSCWRFGHRKPTSSTRARSPSYSHRRLRYKSTRIRFWRSTRPSSHHSVKLRKPNSIGLWSF